MAKETPDFLNVLFEFVDLDKEHKDFLISKLFKYKDDKLVQFTTKILNDNAESFDRFITLCKEAAPRTWEHVKKLPLIVPCPDDLAALRVYPNIMLNSQSGLDSASSTYCNEILKDFLAEYDADMANEKAKIKWQEGVYEKRLTNYVDMPTARALTRYVFDQSVNPGHTLKDNTIRDLADSIDTCRKPMELIYAETPEDFKTMYGTGPHSCMAHSAGEAANWEFLTKEGLAPTSFYAYYPYTKGLYAVKNNKTCARVILFQEADGKWYYGRIYADTSEISQKFIQNMHDLGITQLPKMHEPFFKDEPKTNKGFSFIMPGIKHGSIYAAPWPYMDNMGREQFGATFNQQTKEFTIIYKPDAGVPKINNRSGHIRSLDYIVMECFCCGGTISKGASVIPVEDGEDTLCSDTCAGDMGYVKVYNGTGQPRYAKPNSEYVDVFNSSINKFSTLKAAHDCGFHPMTNELGIFPEDGEKNVINMGQAIVSKDSKRVQYFDPASDYFGILDTDRQFNPWESNRVPVRMIEEKKMVVFDDTADVFVET